MSQTIADGLQNIINAKTDIDGAIEAKGGTVTKGLENSDEDIMTITNQYTQADEGKVVSEGTLIAQTAMPDEITENSTIDTTFYNSVTVNVPSGGGSQPRKDVNFYDYDGTIVNSYTAAEFAELSELPANPTHEGLTAQGWNWSLSDAKSYVAAYRKLNIGQMYASNTTDGRTFLHIRLCEGRLKPYLGLTGNSSGTTVSIDWGDGSTTESVTLDTSTVYTPHEYASDGEYVISILVTGGSISLKGTSYSTNLFRKSSSVAVDNDRVYDNILMKAEIGAGVTSIGNSAFGYCNNLTSVTLPSGVTSIGDYAFSDCYSLASIAIPSSVTSIQAYAFQTCLSLTSVTIPLTVTSIGKNVFYNCYTVTSIAIPSSVTSIGNSAFGNCESLTSIAIPSGVTSIGTSAFQSCRSLTSITIPSGVTSIGAYTFDNCYSLSSITIPSGVTSIGNSAFYGALGLGFIKFSSSTPPTVSASNTWNSVPTDCIIYVPTGTLSAYKSATNYPNPSTYTYEEY